MRVEPGEGTTNNPEPSHRNHREEYAEQNLREASERCSLFAGPPEGELGGNGLITQLLWWRRSAQFLLFVVLVSKIVVPGIQ
jgi:hypothetical protein